MTQPINKMKDPASITALQVLELGAKITFSDGWWISGDIAHNYINFGDGSHDSGCCDLNYSGLLDVLQAIDSQRYRAWLVRVADVMNMSYRAMFDQYPSASFREIYLDTPHDYDRAVMLIRPDFGGADKQYSL